MTTKSVTCTAPVNIAVIKYWGKRDEKLILPANSSVSVTLHQNQLRTKTRVDVSNEFKEDIIWLNGKKEDIQNERVQTVIKELKRRSRKQRHRDNKSAVDKLNWHIHIHTENNFPTAAGLASSAAGYACLVYSLAKLFDVDGDISEIARQGSGSACRSVHGGFVEWKAGETTDGSDSVARSIADEHHWPELHVLILVVNDSHKQTGSTKGMQRTLETSQLFQARIQSIPEKIKRMKKAILDRDFQTFGEIAMKDSNQMHACCLDSYPPITYMTDTSHKIVQLVHWYNSQANEVKVAYTFDAGPNACLFCLEENLPEFYALMCHVFPISQSKPDFFQGLPLEACDTKKINKMTPCLPFPVQQDELKYIIHTQPGPGPQVLEEKEGHPSSNHSNIL